MATLYIEEFAANGMLGGGSATLQTALQPSVTSQTVTISGVSATSSTFNANTKFIRITSDSVCSYSFGTAPTATAASPRLAANISEYFSVMPNMKIAVIGNT